MKTKRKIAGIIILILPFLFAVNILRTQLSKNKDNFMGIGSALELAEDINFSFAGTYIKIAEAGNQWQNVSEGDGWQQIENFFTAVWTSIQVPFVAIGELLKGVYECVIVFVKYVGFLPSGETQKPNKPTPGGGGGSGGGGGGGGGSRPT